MIFTPELVPMRSAPAFNILIQSSAERTPPLAFTLVPLPTSSTIARIIATSSTLAPAPLNPVESRACLDKVGPGHARYDRASNNLILGQL